MEQGRMLTLAAADRLLDLLNETARRFDEVIPAKRLGRDGEEIGPTGLHNLVRHYEHLLARMVEDPETPCLDHYTAEEVLDLAFYAARTGHVDALDLLIERTGFDVTAPDAQGLTLLDHAQRDKQYEVVHYLINRGVGHDRELLPSRTEEA